MPVFLGARRALLVAYRWIVHLRTMNDGEPHPSARAKALSSTFAPGTDNPPWALEMSITSSRLALLGAVSRGSATQIVVWNWVTGEMLLVRQLLLGDRTLMLAVRLGTRYWALPVCIVC